MAKRHRKTRSSHRRRSHAVARFNPPRHHSRRRHYRRNPPIVGFLMEAAKDGLVIEASQLGVAKVRGVVSGMLIATTDTPATQSYKTAGASLLAAAAIAVLGKMALPAHARMIAAGAMAQAMDDAIVQLAPASVTSLLGAYPQRIGAYPRAAGAVAGRVRRTAGWPQLNAGFGPYAPGQQQLATRGGMVKAGRAAATAPVSGTY